MYSAVPTMLGRRGLIALCAAGCALTAAGTAQGSQLIARNASGIRLAVNSRGVAMVTYRDRSRVLHMLARGAVNARVRPPRAGVPQVKFRLDYSGGRLWYGHPVWRRFRNGCGPYDGPQLDWLV